jgi:predicted nucleic acid-binding protein
MAVVVDASAVAALVFGEAESDDVRRRLSDHALHAPSLIEYELANVAWKKLRGAHADAEATFAALAIAHRLNVHLSQPDPVEVLALAVATALTPYDASYLWLARAMGVPLVTLDQRLARAARL